MPKVDYTNSELAVKDGIECLFWIEIAKRKERLQNSEAFAAMLELRRELEAFFEASQADVEDPLDAATDVFLNIAQFENDIEQSVANPEHVHLLRQAIDRFGRRAHYITGQLTCLEGFRLADFSVVTDLDALHAWWSYITSYQGRSELHASGKFSTVGDSRPIPATEELWFASEDSPTVRIGECVNTVTTVGCPVRFPFRVPARHVSAYSTDEHEVTINGHHLIDRVILDFDLLKPLPTMRQIELVIRSAHGAARAFRNLALLEAGIIPEELREGHIAEEGPRTINLLYEPPENHQIMTAYNSFRPMVFGLYCWDLAASGMTDSQAGRRTVSILIGDVGAPVFDERKTIRALTDIVRPRVNSYKPSLLPWNC